MYASCYFYMFFLQYQDAQYHSSTVLLAYFLYYVLILLFMCISTCFDTVYILMAMSTSRGLRKGVSPLEGSAIPLLLFVFLWMYYDWLDKLIDSDSYCFVPSRSPFPPLFSLSLSLPLPLTIFVSFLLPLSLSSFLPPYPSLSPLLRSLSLPPFFSLSLFILPPFSHFISLPLSFSQHTVKSRFGKFIMLLVGTLLNHR